MTVLSGDPHLWSLDGPRGAAVAIGVFDGVHRGHRAVLADLAAVSASGPVVALTFDPHPLEVVAPDRAPRLLGTVDQRVEWLVEEGVDVVGVLPFDRIREWSAPAFMDIVLRDALGAHVVCVGADFRFGYDRSGDAAALAGRGFSVRAVDLEVDGGHPVSSTEIRRRIAAGDVAGAAVLLGRPHTVRGPVVRGEGRGKTIGVPTANVAPDPRVQLPEHGVYAAEVVVEGDAHPAAVNVGVRPTFAGEGVTVEAHLLDGNHDLYGRSVDVAFRERLRAERRFAGVDELVHQIGEDIAAARSVLGQA